MTRHAVPRLLLAVCLALGCARLPAVASEYREPYSGEHFIELCADPAEAVRCGAYVEGVRAGMRAQRLYLGVELDKAKQAAPPPIAPLLRQEPFCLRDGVSTDELVGVVLSFIRANPDRHGESAATAIVVALQNAYPCAG